MKILIILFILFQGFLISVSAKFDRTLIYNEIFMEKVYDFIHTEDVLDGGKLSYCEEVYLKTTRRRAYTEYEENKCGEYFIQKNNEEKAYIKYMMNNRELFY